MTADELRELADKLDDVSEISLESRNAAATYLRSSADALDAGPVATAWMLRGALVNAFPHPPGNESDLRYWIDEGYSEAPLYPLAMPAIPQGWKLVPVEPTPEMVAAVLATAHDNYGRDDPMNCLGWAESKSYVLAAIDAAPTPPVATENTSAGRVAETAEREHIALRLPEPLTDEEVAAMIDETGHMTTDRAVRYLVETGEHRVKEANK